MKEARDTPHAEIIDLRRLNDAERDILHLLAEGHTAKSISSLTGRSVAAVNERLREARRKTGASSSRELARLLRAQKKRSNEMRMASTTAIEASIRIGAAPGTAPKLRKGSIVMGTLVIAAVAAAAFWLQSTGTTEPLRSPEVIASAAKDELLDGMFQRAELEPPRLHGKVRTETRDAVWAGRAEAALQAQYGRLSTSGRVAGLRVLCASSVCEVAGSIVRGRDFGATMQELQSARISSPIVEIGIKPNSIGFLSDRNDRKGGIRRLLATHSIALDGHPWCRRKPSALAPPFWRRLQS